MFVVVIAFATAKTAAVALLALVVVDLIIRSVVVSSFASCIFGL